MSKRNFTKLAYDSCDDLIFSLAKYPVILKNGLSIGGGTLYPEINFTLPPMSVEEATMPQVLGIYREIIEGICTRARELEVSGFVAEIETLPPMTMNPKWGIDVCKTVVDIIKEHEAKYGIKAAVRITPNDIREGPQLQHMWRGAEWDCMLETFEGCANAGADFLAIESVGGKEIHDEATISCDIAKSIFALSIIGCKDMNKLWTEIVAIADKTGTVASGDTACGFGNTAMVLAEKNYIPKVFAAAVRVMTAVRSLVAIECGARGPHKDCGYEGVYIKAITGTPISTEGRVAACAHLSPVGNVAVCMADLWSNESVQHIKLLGGMAPTVSFEQLVYDCRMLNEGSTRGKDTALLLRDICADSDSKLDPQAYVLRPDVVFDISKKLVEIEGYYKRTKAAGLLALEAMREGSEAGRLMLSDREKVWLDNLTEQIEALPEDEAEFVREMLPECDKTVLARYDIEF
ncbi:MAG: methyltransferase MtaB domain-containing protein [Eubacteriales bacterium]|jgi:methanol--5-hydroxybenzimidazolylcobamide Co-methyltransferase|nr:methanol--corrinoid methyltransferase [Clostridiales bacterium]